MKKFIVPIACLFLVACSDDDKKGNGFQGEDLDALSKTIAHSDAECPQNLNGSFCNTVVLERDADGYPTSSEETCTDMVIGTNGSGEMTYSDGFADSPIQTINGKVETNTIDGQAVKSLLYCVDGKLIQKLSASNGSGTFEYTLKDSGQTLVEKATVQVDGQNINETTEYSRQ